MNAECACKVHIGTPIVQMMLHCLIHDDYTKLSTTMLKYFIQNGAQLIGKIFIQHVGLDHSDSGGFAFSMLDLPLAMNRIDCAKVLVKAGIDLVSGGCPGGEKFPVVPMFLEYREYGTNEFICWVFNDFIPHHPEIDLKELTQQIIQSVITMKVKDEKCNFWPSVQRMPAHAILTSHHKKTVEHLVQYGRQNGLNLLAEQSCTGKTALHIAAENGDAESVQILLQL